MTSVEAPLDELVTFLVDTPSVSGNEQGLADWVFAELSRYAHLDLVRHENAVVARTFLGRDQRVVLAGHLDTVPIADNVPSRREGDRLFGCGASDMKAGVAVMLSAAATIVEPRHDLTFVFYDCEEVEAARNGLGRLARHHPEWLSGDLAIVLEPTTGEIEAGCQGTLRVEVTVPGTRAHSARSWLGDNAIHKAGELLRRLAVYEARAARGRRHRLPRGAQRGRHSRGRGRQRHPRRVHHRRQLPVRPRPLRRSGAGPRARGLRAVRAACVTDLSEAARPGLDRLLVKDFVAAVGREPRGQARLDRRGAVLRARRSPRSTWAPGDPNLAHTRGASTSTCPSSTSAPRCCVAGLTSP